MELSMSTVPANAEYRDVVTRIYSTNEAVLTQLGRDLAAEGRLVPVVELRLIDLLNFEHLPLLGDPKQLWQILMDARRDEPELFRRFVSVWHWRQDQWMVLVRQWLRQHGGVHRAGLEAALDALAMGYGHSGLTLERAEQLTVAEALSTAMPIQSATESELEEKTEVKGTDAAARKKPCWERVTRQLFWEDMVIRKYSRKAHAQFCVLDALQAKDWPADGVPAPKGMSIKDAIEALNDGLLTTPLRISAVENYTRITWTILEPA
jgi:hypothetical protein